jgi:hypothetical protein
MESSTDDVSAENGVLLRHSDVSGITVKRRPLDASANRLSLDAGNLIDKARRLRGPNGGISVRDALELATRSDDDPKALRIAIALQLKNSIQATVQPDGSHLEMVDVEPLDIYKGQYESLPEGMRRRCSWQEIERRLLADDGMYLRLSEALNHGGLLFGIDESGNPLFADSGNEPVLTGMNYADTRAAVWFTGEGESREATGYELFPAPDESIKSYEIEMFEAVAGMPFVKSPKGDKIVSSWIESGDNPKKALLMAFMPNYGYTVTQMDSADNKSDGRGVRRLLRVMDMTKRDEAVLLAAEDVGDAQGNVQPEGIGEKPAGAIAGDGGQDAAVTSGVIMSGKEHGNAEANATDAEGEIPSGPITQRSPTSEVCDGQPAANN